MDSSYSRKSKGDSSRKCNILFYEFLVNIIQWIKFGKFQYAPILIGTPGKLQNLLKETEKLEKQIAERNDIDEIFGKPQKRRKYAFPSLRSTDKLKMIVLDDCDSILSDYRNGTL